MIDQYPISSNVIATPSVTKLIWRKTATGGETSLSGYDNSSQALAYTPGEEQVFLNGILLVRGEDYTATNGTTITGLSALSASDFVQVNCYNNFSIASLPATSITGSITSSQVDSSIVTTTETQTLTNKTLTNAIFTGTTDIQQVLEKITVSSTAATGTVNYDLLTNGSILYYTTNASGNWTLNVRGNSGTTLNSIMAIGESLTVAFLVTNGSTAYYQTAFQVDGSAITPKWQGGTAPSSGNTNSIDCYTISIVKTASATYTVFADVAKFS